jgi:ssDNA-binding Zn-finger/Zn-ribbon topoisomerase 1
MARRKKGFQEELVSITALLILASYFLYPEELKAAGKAAAFALLACAVIAAVYFYKKRSNPSTNKTSKILPSKRKASTPVAQAKNTANISKTTSKTTQPPKPPKPGEWSLDVIKSLDWKVFEELCAAYFVAMGRRAEVTENGADGGVDVLLYGQDNPEKVLGIIQCKAWSNKPIGVKAIREMFGVMHDIGCPLGVFAATSGYSDDAKAFAKDKHIKLLDASELLKLIQALPAETQSKLLADTTLGDYQTPSCPSCGTKLISRTAKSGKNAGDSFWGCSSFPKCRYTMQQRKH